MYVYLCGLLPELVSVCRRRNSLQPAININAATHTFTDKIHEAMLRPGEIIVYYKLQKGYHILLALVFRQSPMCVCVCGHTWENHKFRTKVCRHWEFLCCSYAKHNVMMMIEHTKLPFLSRISFIFSLRAPAGINEWRKSWWDICECDVVKYLHRNDG